MFVVLKKATLIVELEGPLKVDVELRRIPEVEFDITFNVEFDDVSVFGFKVSLEKKSDENIVGIDDNIDGTDESIIVGKCETDEGVLEPISLGLKDTIGVESKEGNNDANIDGGCEPVNEGPFEAVRIGDKLGVKETFGVGFAVTTFIGTAVAKGFFGVSSIRFDFIDGIDEGEELSISTDLSLSENLYT